MNRVVLIGNLGGDAEFRELENGTGVARFRLATTEKWKDKDGNPQERTEWTSCTKFGKGTEKLSSYLTKGKKVAVEGSLRTSSFEKDGVKQYRTEVIVDNVELLGSGTRETVPTESEASSVGTSDESPF